MKNIVKFETVSDAIYEKRHMHNYIIQNIEIHLGSKIAVEIHDFIYDLPTAFYYVKERRGQKITNIIKRELKKYVEREELNKSWPNCANRIKICYNSAKTLTAFFADKRDIGEGEYEDDTTCFRRGGENEANKVFLVLLHRAKFLVLREEKEDTILKKKYFSYARCHVYFAGGRTIFLTNFYYNGIYNNKQFFVIAIRKMLGLRHIIYKDNVQFPLPIYTNADGIRLTTNRSFEYPFERKFPCPTCGKKVAEKSIYTDVVGCAHLIGCCVEHLRESSNICFNCEELLEDCSCEICVNCGERVGDNYVRVYRDEYYCPSCYESIQQEGDIFPL